MKQIAQLFALALMTVFVSSAKLTSIEIIRDPHRLAFPVTVNKDGQCSYSMPGVSETQIIAHFDDGSTLEDTCYGFTVCSFTGWNVDFYDGNNQILINDKCRDLEFMMWNNRNGWMRIEIDGKQWYLGNGYPLYSTYWRVNVNEWKVTITEIAKYKEPALV